MSTHRSTVIAMHVMNIKNRVFNSKMREGITPMEREKRAGGIAQKERRLRTEDRVRLLRTFFDLFSVLGGTRRHDRGGQTKGRAETNQW